MKHEKIVTADMQLTKLLISRMLKDRGVDLEVDGIAITLWEAGSSMPMLRFTYPLRKLKIGIESRWARPDDVSLNLITQIAKEQAADFERILSECGDLEANLETAKKIAKREISKGRRLDFSWSYLGTRPSIIEAGGGRTPMPEVFVGMLDASLKIDRFSLVEEDPMEIARDLLNDEVRYDQALRSVRHDRIKSMGAGGAIDAVVLAALAQSGCNVSDVIGRMRNDAQGFVLNAGDISLNLSWNNGFISAALPIAPGVSYRNHELILDATFILDTEHELVGKKVRELIDSPLLEGMMIESIEKRLGNKHIVLTPNYRLYDELTSEPRNEIF